MGATPPRETSGPRRFPLFGFLGSVPTYSIDPLGGQVASTYRNNWAGVGQVIEPRDLYMRESRTDYLRFNEGTIENGSQ